MTDVYGVRKSMGVDRMIQPLSYLGLVRLWLLEWFLSTCGTAFL